MAKSIYLNKFTLLALMFLALGCDTVHAQSTILDNIGNTYQNAASGWSGTLFSIAKGLFLKLALLEMLWFGIMFVLEKDDPKQFLVMLLKKMMALLFFYAILLNFDTWIPAIIDGFSQAGATAGQTGTLTPSGVMERGLSLSTAILDKAQELDWTDIGPFFLAVLVSIMILLAFVVIAGQMLVTLIESYIVVSAGVLFLGFAGSRWTTTFAEKFISFAVSTGVKLFVTYLIIGAGQNLSNTWLGAIQNSPDPSGYLEVLAGAIVYTFLAFQIPSLASSMLTGSVSMTLGGAAATAGTLAGAGLGAAGVVGAMGASAAGGASAVTKTLGAAIGAAKAGGATGALGVAAGAIGALGSATVGAISDGIKGLGGAGASQGIAGRLNATTASLNELKAAGSVAAPTVPGAGGAASKSFSSSPSSPSALGAGGTQSQTPGASGPQANSGPTQQSQSQPAGGTAPTPASASTSGAGSSPGGQNQVPANAPAQQNGAQLEAINTGQKAAEAPTATTEKASGSAGDRDGGSSSSGEQPQVAAPTSNESSIPASDEKNEGVASSSSNPGASSPSGPLQGSGEQGQNTVTAPNSSESGALTNSAPQNRTSTSTSSNSPGSAPANPGIATQKSAPSEPVRPSRPTPPAPSGSSGPQPAAPVSQPKPTLSQRLQEGAQTMGELPNDAAPGAGVQINLKAD